MYLHAPKPSFSGIRVFRNIPLESIIPWIDWGMYYMAWDLKGRYTDLLDADTEVGAEARRLRDDAMVMLDRIVTGRKIHAHAVVGFWPVQRRGDSLDVLPPPCECGVPACAHGEPVARLHFLRQQIAPGDEPLRSLADFFNPRQQDWIGLFAVTGGDGADRYAETWRAQGDDYSAIVVKLLADRFAEALAEKMHYDVRHEHWGYSPDETFDLPRMLAGDYQGIRPAPGYPACPDHTEKGTLWKLLDAEKRLGMTLTESYAMDPAASVCGYYIAHPRSTYFGIGKIGTDQLADYAARKGMPTEEMARWLAPNLAK